MPTKLTNRTVAALRPHKTAYDARDTEIKGFLIRVRPSGSMTYLLQYRNADGNPRHYKIGTVGAITPAQARDIATAKAAAVAQGVDIQAERQKQRKEGEKARYNTLGGFLETKYAPWVLEHRRHGPQTLRRIKRHFGDLYSRPLTEINSWVIEKWRSERLKAGIRKETVNRDVMSLKAAISKAVEWEIIAAHPLAKVKPLKLDRTGKVRYLSDTEETRLRKSLTDRDAKIKDGRESGNQWRKERGYDALPTLKGCTFADHLTPIVLLTLNTGLRRGEVFNLRWADINFQTKTLTVRGEGAKSGETRHIPLNLEALEALKQWKRQSGDSDQVFPGRLRERLDNIKTSWRELISKAKIQNFRFHDVRHSFASKLVMRGVPLNTIRELLGHSDLSTTLRYAHLAPDHKAEAVALLSS